MPVKRRLAKVKENRITPAAVIAFRAGDREALHRALALRPWEVSPLDVHEGESPWPGNSGGAQSWEKAKLLSAELSNSRG